MQGKSDSQVSDVQERVNLGVIPPVTVQESQDGTVEKLNLLLKKRRSEKRGAAEGRSAFVRKKTGWEREERTNLDLKISKSLSSWRGSDEVCVEHQTIVPIPNPSTEVPYDAFGTVTNIQTVPDPQRPEESTDELMPVDTLLI